MVVQPFLVMLLPQFQCFHKTSQTSRSKATMHHPLATQATEPVCKAVAPTHSLLSFQASCQCLVCIVAVSSVRFGKSAYTTESGFCSPPPPPPPPGSLSSLFLLTLHVYLLLCTLTLVSKHCHPLFFPSMLSQQVNNLQLPNAFSLLLLRLSLCVHLYLLPCLC